eukprot:1378053-Amorphochlora_amoeboformis.AAC.3
MTWGTSPRGANYGSRLLGRAALRGNLRFYAIWGVLLLLIFRGKWGFSDRISDISGREGRHEWAGGAWVCYLSVQHVGANPLRFVTGLRTSRNSSHLL